MIAESSFNTLPILVVALIVITVTAFWLLRGRSSRDVEAISETPAPVAVAPITEEPQEVPEVATALEPEVAVERPRMGRMRSAFASALTKVSGRAGIGDETYEDLEEALLRADVGVKICDELLTQLKDEVKKGEVRTPEEAVSRLRDMMLSRIVAADRSLTLLPSEPGSPNVWLFVGVNGVGKTTSIGKVASQQISLGRSVLLGAGDTFRAAAAEQLATWAERSGSEFVRGAEGADPSSVIFDAIESAASKSIELVLADTAGRLHTKSNLMEELAKVRRVAEKGRGRVSEVLLVIDATTGQNGLVQAREFAQATAVTGVILTKLDGSAKGGIVFAIETELGIPVKLVGLGEKIDDLVEFDPAEYISALFAA